MKRRRKKKKQERDKEEVSAAFCAHRLDVKEHDADSFWERNLRAKVVVKQKQ